MPANAHTSHANSPADSPRQAQYTTRPTHTAAAASKARNVTSGHGGRRPSPVGLPAQSMMSWLDSAIGATMTPASSTPTTVNSVAVPYRPARVRSNRACELVSNAVVGTATMGSGSAAASGTEAVSAPSLAGAS